ncbi:MCE family protein [Amycolatopsis albispora]|uniref:Uncharacterized protein n=1 Tax=Amycolatopsis albispora TaxID=1804986 RepID=A0A344L526_9PSEU|nr:MCE family protein [Amycolatopsis albispora]AXB43150.1 hypothetical protein A4R43_11800 [Amycolatopsis albispora]
MKATVVKALAFAVVSVCCGAFVVNTLTTPLRSAAHGYRAEFTDATGLYAGAAVLIGGVRAGQVTSVGIENGHAVAELDIEAQHHLPADVRLVIRYADLLGGRTIAVVPGPSGPAGQPALAPGSLVPLANTQPALDLTALLNGFRPLFDSLDPAQVNQLAGELIATFQGQGGTVRSLLARTVSVTEDLASRREVISGVLANLNSLVDFSLTHRADFQELLDSLNTLVTGLAEDAGQLGGALDAGTDLAATLSGTVDRLGPEVGPLVNSLTATGKTLNDNSDALADAVGRAPALLEDLNRTLDYGSWVNIYVCNLRLDTGPLGEWDLSGGPHSAVCR